MGLERKSHPNDDREGPALETILLQTARAIRRAYDTRLAPLGLSMTQAALLLVARDSGPLTQRDLADRLHVGRAATGDFIDALEERSLVVRSSDANDRRVWLISITREALPLIDAFEHIDRTIRLELHHSLSIRERQLLTELLDRLHRNAIAAAAVEKDSSPEGRLRDVPGAGANRSGPEP